MTLAFFVTGTGASLGLFMSSAARFWDFREGERAGEGVRERWREGEIERSSLESLLGVFVDSADADAGDEERD